MPNVETLRTAIARHWFLLLLPGLALAGWALVRTAPAADAATVELVLLADVCLSLPLLYALCYARRLPFRTLLIRCVGLAAAGVAILGWTLPAEQQNLLTTIKPIRIAGTVVVALIELRILIAVVRLVFSSAPSQQALTDRGVPPLIARLMLIEARFWKAVWRLLRRR